MRPTCASTTHESQRRPDRDDPDDAPSKIMPSLLCRLQTRPQPTVVYQRRDRAQIGCIHTPQSCEHRSAGQTQLGTSMLGVAGSPKMHRNRLRPWRGRSWLGEKVTRTLPNNCSTHILASYPKRARRRNWAQFGQSRARFGRIWLIPGHFPPGARDPPARARSTTRAPAEVRKGMPASFCPHRLRQEGCSSLVTLVVVLVSVASPPGPAYNPACARGPRRAHKVEIRPVLCVSWPKLADLG